jgi:hypothetical protein
VQETVRSSDIATQGPRRRPSVFARLFLIAVGFLLPLVAAELILRLLPVHSALRTADFNSSAPVMRFKPDANVTFSKGWNFKIVTHRRINNDGFFNDQNYSPNPVRPLLGIIGDSYIEASMVSYPETVYGRLANQIGTNGSVYSFAMDGAPLSQYVAWSKYAAETYHPEMLVCLIIANDFDESLYRIGSGMHFGYFYTPVESDGYELRRADYHRSAVRDAMSHSALCRYLFYNCEIAAVLRRFRGPQTENVGNTARTKSPEVVSESRGVIKQFMKDMLAYAKLPPTRILFLIDGRRPELYSPDLLQADKGSFFTEMREAFLQEAQRANIEAIDLEPLFVENYKQHHQRFEWEFEQHWNGLGHEVAASAVEHSKTFQGLFGGRKK